jgi:hypothetical protein
VSAFPMESREQYRITWKREGNAPKSKLYARRSSVDRFLLILGPEPWLAFGRTDPAELYCCDGYECGCDGETVREHFLGERKNFPPIEWITVQRRDVELGPWCILDDNPPREGGST